MFIHRLTDKCLYRCRGDFVDILADVSGLSRDDGGQLRRRPRRVQQGLVLEEALHHQPVGRDRRILQLSRRLKGIIGHNKESKRNMQGMKRKTK